MKIIDVEHRVIDPETYKVDRNVGSRLGSRAHVERKVSRGFRNAYPEDVSRLITEDTLVRDAATGKVVIAYMHIPEDSTRLVELLKEVKFYTGYRTDGSPTGASVIAGTRVASHIRRLDYCSTGSLALHNPAAHDALMDFALVASRHYAEVNPELYAYHQGMAAELKHREWVIGDSPFTSGIVNRDNVLPYHYDKGNVVGGWSMMLGLKHAIEGGHLVIPEYDLALEIANNTLSGFDGQIALHGVSPIRKLDRTAYRFTIVYYAKAGAWRCLSEDEELLKGRRIRTMKERNRAGIGTAAE